MSNVLFVKANDRPADQAISVKLYDTFLESYKQSHPEDQITELDLFTANLPYYDSTAMTGMFKLAKGMELTSVEQNAADVVNGYLDQFLAADKVVIAFPLWNFTVPAQLITYLTYLCQAGKTFSYTAQGPVGLAGAKKVVLLNARGGVYSEGPMAQLEMSLNYVKNIMGFFGVTDIETTIIEGHNQFPDRAQSIVEEGLNKATKQAASF
ncbi:MULTISPECIES: FMN-dependent NADH-azoreductase [unclassified Paenibacillus]|uniref:FMN-dependent NADH-azoreductase n=1 Tax=unclassified Paenibacillus TaxID=185978 RepID=UPI001AE916CB|nr:MULTISPECIES: FMN-dependent NADH-azoreductase [unclassified Paenibacillus]MBP1154684.1 FMN-dependent NADH-azoreductase [Paenibacillus sp. PvP091]MBP1169932.1 FMN-dependent NADH-azoreductase [Paenibacillus sp. PvR098]MBP2440960.1 FMN-dependent NADH-azoreductase [Paenibacillus sp. PvP052]